MRKKYEMDYRIKYDYCIRTRPDIIHFETINFEMLKDVNLDDNIIIGFGVSLGYPDDNFAICVPKMMDEYSDLNFKTDVFSAGHGIVKSIIDKYPVWLYVQIGIYRKWKEEEGKNFIIINDNPDTPKLNRSINYYNKHKYMLMNNSEYIIKLNELY